jgi:hypothetical protein
MKHIPSFENFLNESLNEGKKITVITYGNKEHVYTDKDIQEFIKDPNISADNLPGWMYGAALRGAQGFPKKPKQVVDYLEKILKHKGNVTINVASDKPSYQNSIVFESALIKESRNQEWIVFLPIEKGDIVDINDSLFGVYNDEEYDRIAPFDKVKNYTTSSSFSDMKTAREYADLVKLAKGDMKSSAFKKADEFEKKNKIVR